MASRRQQFGGQWTEKKLQVLINYLKSYKVALSKQPFKLLYIDAFAGSGERFEDEDNSQGQLSLGDVQRVFQGSAQMALELNFDEYIFIEQNADNVERLRAMLSNYPYPERVQIIQGDANVELQRICQERNWHRWRGVLFLDPFGMSVSWVTLEVVAKTRVLDVWVLVPLGVAINRLLPNSGVLNEGWDRALTRFFGNRDWYGAAYRADQTIHQTSLFSGPVEITPRANLANIEAFFIQRLDEIFGCVLEETLHLENGRGDWMYSLCFMMATPNESAWKIGKKIARHLIRGMR